MSDPNSTTLRAWAICRYGFVVGGFFVAVGIAPVGMAYGGLSDIYPPLENPSAKGNNRSNGDDCSLVAICDFNRAKQIEIDSDEHLSGEIDFFLKGLVGPIILVAFYAISKWLR